MNKKKIVSRETYETVALFGKRDRTFSPENFVSAVIKPFRLNKNLVFPEHKPY